MNRLQHETSPYLLQHKDNPVDWYAWGEEAFSQSKAQNKPILLSVGYSACHWCHVMAHESFEDPETAEMMNRLFINVKVDREERPDIDDIYMQAVMAMRRSGGWPMTVFLFPDGRPFYGGTYYPREPRYGMPSFMQVMDAVYDAYVNRHDELSEQADNLTSSLDRAFLRLDDVSDDGFSETLLEAGAKGLLADFDEINGGFGGAPKFPNPMNLAYLLRFAHHTQRDDALSAVSFSLQKMAHGGIYDHVGGGFHRYAVDEVWLVPHFEKMLYDNAQLSRLYAQAYRATGNEAFKRVACDIYDYVLREMTAPEGGFYSATDADSEGEEGKFFVWTIDELEASLASLSATLPNASEIAIEYFSMSRGGNFEGTNILNIPTEPSVVAKRLSMPLEELESAIQQIKDRLYATRTNRPFPLLDDKVITSWNGMMLASLAEGARLLNRPDYLGAAERGGDFFLNDIMASDGRLFRTSKNEVHKGNAYLEDYANLIDAFLELYQSTFLGKWFVAAQKLAEFVLAHFLAETQDGFFDTSNDHEQLIVRPRSLQDNAVPSGNSMMSKQLLRLFALTGNPTYEEVARNALRPLLPAMQQYPQAFGEALNAVDMLVRGAYEVALIGNPTQAPTKALLAVLHEGYYPNAVVALARESIQDSEKEPIALLHHRPQKDGQPTAYVCRHFICANPTTSPAELESLLRV